MKKLVFMAFLTLASNSYAGLVTRTYTYTDGNTISANENNTNENTLYNEINGNLDSNNLTASAVNTSEIAANAVTMTKLDTNLQSFFTYRRPVLVFVDTNTVDVEGNTGTQFQTCVYFPDERRCVTENTSSTDQFRRFKINATASLSGTWDSGIRSGLTLGASTWWLIYAVKTTDNSSNFVLVGDSVTPTQSNLAILNTNFGSNSWTYLGAVRYGDNFDFGTRILKFTQSGNLTMFHNVKSATNPGIVMSSHTTGTTLAWSYVAGVSSAAVPGNLSFGFWVLSVTGAATPAKFQNSAATINWHVGDTGASGYDFPYWTPIREGAALDASGSGPMTINFSGFLDGVLGVGGNPQL